MVGRLPENQRTARAKFARKRVKHGIAAPCEMEDDYLLAKELDTPRRSETPAALLPGRHHSESGVEKIPGGNVRRLFGEAWA
jgi:membrane dipeptidase